MLERRNVREELEAKAAEMLRQQELAKARDDGLNGYDKTVADSFPASDPPESSAGIHI